MKTTQLLIVATAFLFNACLTQAELINWALDGRASQSTEGAWYGRAERAIDGNIDGNWGGGSVSHTYNYDNQWWEVDLGSSKPIGCIQIFWRTDWHAGEQARVVVYDKADKVTRQEVWSMSGLDQSLGSQKIQLPSTKMGQVVRVEFPSGISQYLCIAEVQVFNESVVPTIDKVICVPWQGDPFRYHTTIDGQNHRLKGVIKTFDKKTIYVKWLYGDGAESAVTTLSGASYYNVESDHIYNGAVGTPFTAQLMVDSVDASMANAKSDPYHVKIEQPNLDSKVNVAIDNGLWYLHKRKFRNDATPSYNGRAVAVWGDYGNYYAAPTASAIQSMQINGHKQTGNPNEDPYVTDVNDGLNWIFNGFVYNESYPMLQAVNIGAIVDQNGKNTDNNGIGIQVRDYGYAPIYEGGMVMDAIVATGTPDADCGRDFDADGINETYREVLQDMCDMYAYGQYRGPYGNGGKIIGGWRYSWGDWPDNSAAQWAAIGMIPAQQFPWNCVVPQWVKDYDNNWLDYSYWTDGTSGGFGYTGSGAGWATTPCGMVQLDFAGMTTDDQRWKRCEFWLANNWQTFLDQYNVYGNYAFAKAMRLAKPSPVVTFSYNNFDWYRGDSGKMGLAERISNQLIQNHCWDYYGVSLGTAWSVITLRPVLFQEAPIATFTAHPNPSYANFPINFDPRGSGHSKPGKDIRNLVLFEWDWNNDGVFEQSTTTPDEVTHSFAATVIPSIFPVKLRVTDDEGLQATYALNVNITNPPHPPVAKTKDLYVVSLDPNDQLILDGSASFDPDAGKHEDGNPNLPNDQITAWAWDLNGAPWGYDNAQGQVVDLGNSYTTYFKSAGIYQIGLRVTDNTSKAFPSSGKPDLTDETFTQVQVYDAGVPNLKAIPDCQKVLLTWDNVGASQYTIYRSYTGPNADYEVVGTTTSNSKLLDEFTMNKAYWYRVKAEFANISKVTMSLPLKITGSTALCNPVSNPGGPYLGFTGEIINLDGSGSYARTDTLVTWEWDINGDGVFGDVNGAHAQYRWNIPGIYRIGLKVTSSGSAVLNDTAYTTVVIKLANSINDLATRPKVDKIQLTWSPQADAQSYNVYRSTTPWFDLSSQNRIVTGLQTSYATYLDSGLKIGMTYFYKVTKVVNGKEVAVSNESASTLKDRTTPNVAPIANAGMDQLVAGGATVNLDGSASFDPEAKALVYAWSFVTKPAGSAAILVNPSNAKPYFVADAKGAYVIKLSVFDGVYWSASDSVAVTTLNREPKADAGQDTVAHVGETVTLSGARSYDLDKDTLTYRWYFTQRPLASAAILANNDKVVTSFTIDKPGAYEVALVVNDGMADSAPDTVRILTSNTAPVANAGPDVSGVAGRLIRLDGSKSSDVDGQQLAYFWSVISSPSGSHPLLQQEKSASPAFTPDLGGLYQIQLIVNDGDLNSAPAFVKLTVDTPPTANAGSDQTVKNGDTVQLDGSASTDVENDPLTYAWTLVTRPAGSAAALSDAKAQKPTFKVDVTGDYVAQLVVNDGKADSQPVQVTIHTANTAPVANAGPDQVVELNTFVQLFGGGSSDVDKDPLTYKWTVSSKPQGSLAQLSSLTAANPTFKADVKGAYVFQLVVNDGKADSAAATVTVQTKNHPPVANAGPAQAQFAGEVIQLNGGASSDPDGDSITYAWTLASVPSSSAAALAKSDTVAPTFTPDIAGQYGVQLIVSDGKLNSEPSTVIITAKPFVLVPDIVGLTPAQAEAALTAAGLSVTTVPAKSSSTVVKGLIAAQYPVAGTKVTPGVSISVAVSKGPDVEPPVVSIVVAPPKPTLGGTVNISVQVADDSPIASLTAKINGTPVTLVNNQASFHCDSPGVNIVEVRAVDSQNNEAVVTKQFAVVDPSDTIPPVVAITSPDDEATVTKPVDIIGDAYDPDGKFDYYVLEYAPVDAVNMDTLQSDQFVELARSAVEVKNGKLGAFDPTLLQNDSYLIKLSAWDLNGNGYQAARILNVSGNLKLGEFRLEFTDLSVPVAGVPIQVKRIYDTRQSLRTKDFGYGWSLGIMDAQIRKTKRPSYIGPTMYPGSRVYINTPDGRRVGFTTHIDFLGAFGFVFVKVTFNPDPGVYEKLAINGDNTAILFDGVIVGGLATEPYDPTAFKLTLKDGTVFVYDQYLGLQQVTDLNVNRLEVTSAGVFHYPAGSTVSDVKIDFVRDAKGRITKVIDPAGHAINYTYDADGNLSAVADQESNETKVSYRTDRKHYLDSIIDPLGNRAVKTEYDAQGRVVAIMDALGHRTEQTADLSAFSGTYTDANGNVTTVFYDDRGNEIKKVDPEGGAIEFQFDANNNEIWRRDPRGNVTQHTYDDRGNCTSVTDAVGHVTRMEFNQFNKPTTIVDALGRTTRMTYDAQGLAIGSINPDGVSSAVTRDAQGRVSSVTDFNGHTTQYDYEGGCACGKPGRITYPDGTSRSFQYDSMGRTIGETDELGQTTSRTYDNAGRLVAIKDPNGSMAAYTYSGTLKVSQTDPMGRVTRFSYDAANRLVAVTDPENGVVRYEYDAAGKRTAVTDPSGNTSRFVYDMAGRLIREMDALGHSRQYAYDAAGNQIEVIDRNGRRLTFEYDALNRGNREIWWDGSAIVRTIDSTFNAVGMLTEVVDPTSQLSFEFDNLLRLRQSAQHAQGLPDFALNYQYDNAGNVVSVVDNWGVQTASEFDSRDRRSLEKWQGPTISGVSVRYAYDAAGNRASIERFADLGGAQMVSKSSYNHNAIGAITDLVHSDGVGAILATYHYDRDLMQQVAMKTANGASADYQYDSRGQLTVAAYHGIQSDETFNYDADGNRSGGSSQVGADNRIMADGTYAYSYDNEGNMIGRNRLSSGETSTYEYDHRNRLTRVVNMKQGGGASQVVEYVFDPMNRRIWKSVDGQRFGMLYNGNNIWADCDATGNVTQRYLLGGRIDEMLARHTVNQGVVWYLADADNSIVGHASASGALLNRIDYSAFGKVVSESNPAAGDRFGFTSREREDEIGLYFYRARFYSPDLGRFISKDPLSFESGESNLYRYCKNNPLLYTDPYGLMMVEYTITFDLSVNKLAAAYIGSWHGFAATTFSFMGHFLEVVNTGKTLEEEWAWAMEQTENDMNRYVCGGSVATAAGKVVGGEVGGIVGAYFSGYSTIKVTYNPFVELGVTDNMLSIGSKLLCKQNIFEKNNSSFGFKNGVSSAIGYFASLAPK